jgi:hypothetical protein
MKKLTKKETLQTLPRVMGRGRLTHPFVEKLGKEVLKLKVGESLLCSHNEWELVGPPGTSAINAYLKRIKSPIKTALKSLQHGKTFIIVRII